MNNNFNESKNISEQIKDGDYNFFSASAFFVNDVFRLIKFIIIFISFILNLLYIISYIKIKAAKKIKYKKNSFSFMLIINILIVNFIHSSSYLLNWMRYVKNDYYEFSLDENHKNKKYHIGGLLIGNPKNKEWVCLLQGYLMIFSSLSQDSLINVFFYFINNSEIPKKLKSRIILIIFGYAIPFLFSIIYIITKNVGINFRFCYVKKFYFENGYIFNNNYILVTSVLYGFRFINLIISLIFLFKITQYVKSEDLNKKYILRAAIILITQIITILIDIINILCDFFIDDEKLLIVYDIFLCINTLDCIIFPFIFSLFNSTYRNLFCNLEMNESLATIEEEFNNNPESLDSSLDANSRVQNDKNKFSLVRFVNTNNFDMSF